MKNEKNAWKSITVIAVVLTVLAIAMVGTASAKSAYVIASWDTSPNPINAYDIQGNNLFYQTTNTVPFHGYGAMGLTIDTDSKTLFVSYEASNIIEKINAETFEVLGNQTATGASNGAGIVVDQPKGLVYWIDRGSPNLYIYDVATFTLQNAVTLPTGAGGWGLAIDGNRLFVGDFTNTVRYYDTTSWAELGSVTLSYPVVGVAVDSKNRFLYAGSYTGSNYLMKYDLTTGVESSVSVGTGIQVRGVAVDQATGLVYITSGEGWSNLGKVEVFDSNLNFLSSNIINDDPTGICVPSEEISYNPLNLTKGDGLAEDECVAAGGSITYDICYDNMANAYNVSNVTIVDNLPPEVSFTSASGSGTYDSSAHTVTWDIGTLPSGAPQQCVQLVVNVGTTATPGSNITNSATINSDQTPPTTVNENTAICLNQPPDVSDAYPSIDCLWPPNHKFVDITIEGITDPDGDEVTITITNITSDEPTASIEGAGGAKHVPDADPECIGTAIARVRSERSGDGNGRVYEITFVASDGIAETVGNVLVKVPHNQSGDCVSIDSGQNYDATEIN